MLVANRWVALHRYPWRYCPPACSCNRTRLDLLPLSSALLPCSERDLMAMQQPKLEVSAEKQAASAAAAVTASTTAVTGSGVSATARPQIPLGMGGQAWVGQQPRADGPRIAFIVTTSDSLQQIRVWVNYHRSIGVSTFYIFADGQVGAGSTVLGLELRACVGCMHDFCIPCCRPDAPLLLSLQAARPDNVAALRATPGVTVVLRDAELRKRHENSRRVLSASRSRSQLDRRSPLCCPANKGVRHEARVDHCLYVMFACTPLCCRIWKESWLSAFFHKPCNHELFVLQSLNMEGGCCFVPLFVVCCSPCFAARPRLTLEALTKVSLALISVNSALCPRADTRADPAHLRCLCSAVGIEMAQRDGIDWLLHVDTDELIYPSDYHAATHNSRPWSLRWLQVLKPPHVANLAGWRAARPWCANQLTLTSAAGACFRSSLPGVASLAWEGTALAVPVSANCPLPRSLAVLCRRCSAPCRTMLTPWSSPIMRACLSGRMSQTLSWRFRSSRRTMHMWCRVRRGLLRPSAVHGQWRTLR